MAHAFSLTDGTTTFSLTSTTAFLREYDMGELPVGENGPGAIGQGPDTVTDSISLFVRGTTAANMQTNVRTLEKLVDDAKRRTATGIGPIVYVQAQLDSDSSIWRARILDGAVDLNASSLAIWANLMVEVTLTIEREADWEGVEVELQLSGPSQAAATGGRTIYNHWDTTAAHGYWLEIAAAQVTGSVPGPLRLEMTNSAGAGRAYTQIHMAVNRLNDPANFVGRIEGEAASSGGSTVADAMASDGNKRTVTVNTSATLTWALNATFMQDTQGARFWMLARVSDLTGPVTVRPELRSSAGTVVWRAHEPMQISYTDPNIAVLGTIPLPPGGWYASWGATTLALVLASDSSISLSIDFIAFFPCEGYQLMTMLGQSVGNGDTVVLDGMARLAGVQASGTWQAVASPRGDPLLLEPNTLQRIYILQMIDGGMNIGDTFSVRAYYRPRRRSV